MVRVTIGYPGLVFNTLDPRVAIDRGMSVTPYALIIHLTVVIAGLRLADKRSLPCPNRLKWLQARDELYEEIMEKAWNPEGKYFGQSYDETRVLDSSVLIMPLVFFIQAVSSLDKPDGLNTIIMIPVRSSIFGNIESRSSNTPQGRSYIKRELSPFRLCSENVLISFDLEPCISIQRRDVS